MDIQRIKQKPFVTYLLLIVMAVVFLWETLNGGSTNPRTLLYAGAKVNSLVSDGQWWRLITPIFVHLGPEHIIVNGITLYFLGLQLEPLYGHFKYLIIFLITGIAGNLMSYAFGNGNIISAGASTSLFGLFGIYVALGCVYRKSGLIQQWARQFGLLILINIISDLFISNIDIMGHIGGVLAGFLLGIMISIPNITKTARKSWRLIACIVLLLGMVVLYMIGDSLL